MSKAETMVREIVDSLIEKSFPGLADSRIEIEPMSAKSDFFRARFRVLRVLFGYRPRIYLIEYNRKLGEAGYDPPRDGIEAILAHEMAHLQEYEGMNSLLCLVRIIPLHQVRTPHRHPHRPPRLRRWPEELPQLALRQHSPGFRPFKEEDLPQPRRDRRPRKDHRVPARPPGLLAPQGAFLTRANRILARRLLLT